MIMRIVEVLARLIFITGIVLFSYRVGYSEGEADHADLVRKAAHLKVKDLSP